MKKSQNVFFQKDLTPEEEYSLIFYNQVKEEKKEVPKLIFGNKLLPTAEDLSKTNFHLTIGTKYSNGLTQSIILCLFSNSLFYKMIENIEDKINHRTVYTPFLCQLLHFKRHPQLNEIQPGSDTDSNTDIPQSTSFMKKNTGIPNIELAASPDDNLQTYRTILKRLHLDFISTHFFEQEDWNSTQKKIYKFDKKLYPEFSPIVEIFHGEYEGTDRVNQQFKITKDLIQLHPDTVKKDHETTSQSRKYVSSNARKDSSDHVEEKNNLSVKDCIKHSLSLENLRMSKYPLILTLASNPSHMIILEPRIQLNKRKYNLNSFITKEENDTITHLKLNNGWVVCRNGTVQEYSRNEDIAQPLLMAFYQIDKIMN